MGILITTSWRNESGDHLSPLNSIEDQAHDAWERDDIKSARKLFAKGASLGFVSCMLNLGYFFDEGIGARRNKSTAMIWYKRAYRKGSAAAASNIAILYKEQNRHRLSFQWYRKATELGDGDADLEVARLYFLGCGVRRSLPLAKAHLTKALLPDADITESGQEDAIALLGEVKSALQSSIDLGSR